MRPSEIGSKEIMGRLLLMIKVGLLLMITHRAVENTCTFLLGVESLTVRFPGKNMHVGTLLLHRPPPNSVGANHDDVSLAQQMQCVSMLWAVFRATSVDLLATRLEVPSTIPRCEI